MRSASAGPISNRSPKIVELTFDTMKGILVFLKKLEEEVVDGIIGTSSRDCMNSKSAIE